MNKTEDDYVFLPTAEIMSSGGMVNHIKDHWWVVHPERGLVFYPFSKKKPRLSSSSPQANSNKSMAERLAPSWARIEFFNSVLCPINVTDYHN